MLDPTYHLLFCVNFGMRFKGKKENSLTRTFGVLTAGNGQFKPCLPFLEFPALAGLWQLRDVLNGYDVECTSTLCSPEPPSPLLESLPAHCFLLETDGCYSVFSFLCPYRNTPFWISLLCRVLFLVDVLSYRPLQILCEVLIVTRPAQPWKC